MTAPKQPHQKARTYSIHKAINWVVSFVLILFAVWSITLNAEGRAQFKQATATFDAIEQKVQDTRNDLMAVKAACQSAPVVIPLPTTLTQ